MSVQVLAPDPETAIICGHYDLLAATFGEDRAEVRERHGLPSPYPICPVCSGQRRLGYETCSSECMAKLKGMRIPLYCDNCGVAFWVYKSTYDYKISHPNPLTGKPQERFFCSKKCCGSYAGRNYGFPAHPENRPKRFGPRYKMRKYDYEVVAGMLKRGCKSAEVARELYVAESYAHFLCWRVRREFGLASPRKKYDWAKVTGLYFSGVKPLAIASEVGCHESTVYSIINSIKRRVPQLRGYSWREQQ